MARHVPERAGARECHCRGAPRLKVVKEKSEMQILKDSVARALKAIKTAKDEASGWEQRLKLSDVPDTLTATLLPFIDPFDAEFKAMSGRLQARLALRLTQSAVSGTMCLERQSLNLKRTCLGQQRQGPVNLSIRRGDAQAKGHQGPGGHRQ